MKQYQLPGGPDEFTATAGELEKVGLIRAAHGPFNSPVWPVKRPEGTWRVKGEYRELSEVIPLLHAAGLSLRWTRCTGQLMGWELTTLQLTWPVPFPPLAWLGRAGTSSPPRGTAGGGLLPCALKGTCTARISVTGLGRTTWLSGHGLQRDTCSITAMASCQPAVLCRLGEDTAARAVTPEVRWLGRRQSQAAGAWAVCLIPGGCLAR